MKNYKALSAGAIILLTASCASELPEIIEMPYTDGNTLLPATELTQVERTDTSTVLTFMTMYDYHDINLPLGNKIYLTSNEFDKLPLTSLEAIGATQIVKNNVVLKKGIPSQFKMTFPALPEKATSIDFIQENNGKISTAIWGIDLTGNRSANALPEGIPSALLEHDFVNDTLPHLVTNSGTATVNIHVIAWRHWMSKSGKLIINNLAEKQKSIPFTLDDNGETSIEIPLDGTANISAYISTNTYASTYIDPDETINMYLLPNNYSESQRGRRPTSVTDGKYRDLSTISDMLWDFQVYADTILIGKTNTNDFFNAIMALHQQGLDSIKAREFPPMVERAARAGIDRKLLYHMLTPDGYTTSDWDERDNATPDIKPRFSPNQLTQIRSSIDFTNPMLELQTLSNPGVHTKFIKALDMLK